MILEEFDEAKDAVVNPFNVKGKIEGFPKIGVTCFSKTLIDEFIKEFKPTIIETLHDANLDLDIYKINYNGVDIAVFMSLVGAPACIASLEEVFTLGLEKVIVFGTCGVLSKDIEDLSITIPTVALRDEGTSYHYAKPSREIIVNDKYKEEFINILTERNISYTLGKVWTTDAIYRETKDKVKRRKEEGCVCVDMEASAIKAVANFREKDVFQFFYAADNLDNEEWDKRSLMCSDKVDEKMKALYLALELATKIGE